MSNRQSTDTRAIHPHALAKFGLEVCLVALEVADDLRSGVIPPEQYDQREWCGSACCIAGHIACRMKISHSELLDDIWDRSNKDVSILDLFRGHHPSVPNLAADAIERAIYDGSETPWDL